MTITSNTPVSAQLRLLAESAKRRKHAHLPLYAAADLIDDLVNRNTVLMSQAEFRKSHPFHPAVDLEMARNCARYFACNAPGCTAPRWQNCRTVSMTDHDDRLTYWLTHGRPVGPHSDVKP